MCSNILSSRQHCLSVPFQMSKWKTLFYQVLSSILHGVDFTSTLSERDGILGGDTAVVSTHKSMTNPPWEAPIWGGGGIHCKLRTEIPKSSMCSNLGAGDILCSQDYPILCDFDNDLFTLGTVSQTLRVWRLMRRESEFDNFWNPEALRWIVIEG